MKPVVAKVLMLSLILGPVAVLGGCAKKCGEPVMKHRMEKMEKMERERGGK